MNYKKIILLLKLFFNSNKKSYGIGFIKIVTFVSIFLGTLALILSLSVLEGFDKTLHEKAFAFSSDVNGKNYYSSKIDKKEIEYILNKYNKEIKSIEYQTESQVLLKSKTLIEGIILKGLDSPLNNQIINNYLLKDSRIKNDNNSIWISDNIANKYSLKIGDAVLIFSMSNIESSSDYKTKKLIVQGIYKTGFMDYDNHYCYTYNNICQSLLNYKNNEYNNIEIKLNNTNKADSFAQILNEIFMNKVTFYSINQIYANIFDWINLQKKPIPIVLSIITIVAALNIITTLLVLIVEKTKVISILRVLGAEDKIIKNIFLIQGIFISVIATITGILFSLILLFIQKEYGLISLNPEIYFIDRVPVEINIYNVLIVGLLSILISVPATMIPSRVAIKLNLIRGLKFN